MKKILSLILAVGLLACLFAGCGSDKNNDADDATGSPASDPAASSKTLVMATNAEFPPYEYLRVAERDRRHRRRDRPGHLR